MMKQIKDWLFGHTTEAPYTQIDKANKSIDKSLNILTSLCAKFRYLYTYSNSLSKDERLSIYNEIQTKLEEVMSILSEVKDD